MHGLHLTAGSEAFAEFMAEWKDGYRGLTDEITEANRLVMQHQLFMLITSGGKTTGKQAPKKEG